MPGLILIVDDEEIIRMTLSEILNELGYDVECASTGDEGMDILRDKHNSISLVILDMLMPGKSGVDLYHEIKDLFPSMKILITSGYREDENMEQMLKASNDGFIQKPYTIDGLNCMILNLISQ